MLKPGAAADSPSPWHGEGRFASDFAKKSRRLQRARYLFNILLARTPFTLDTSRRAAECRRMIEVTRQGNAVVFRVKETQLQMYSIPQFKAAVASQLVDKPKLVVFDMTLVEHVDSSAMGALFHFQRELKTWGGLLRVAHLTHKVTQIFKITRSENAFEICDTVAEALKGA